MKNIEHYTDKKSLVQKIYNKFYQHRFVNTVLILYLVALIVVLIIKNRFHLNLLLSNINSIIFIIGGLIYLNINYKLGCIIVISTFLIYSVFVFYIMPWNFNLLSYLVMLFSMVYILYETIKRIKK